MVRNLTAQLPGGNSLVRARHEELQNRLDELRGLRDIGRGVERTRISDGGEDNGVGMSGMTVKKEDDQDVEMVKREDEEVEDDAGSVDAASLATRRHRGWNALPVSFVLLHEGDWGC